MSDSTEPTPEKIRERITYASDWHRDIAELEQVMARNTDFRRPLNLADHGSNMGFVNWGLDLIRRISRLEMLHYLIESDPPLADAMQHPVVPPEPKRLAGIMTRNLSAIPFMKSMLQRALAGQPISFNMSETNPDVAVATGTLA